MTVHLIKMAVGVTSTDHLVALQKGRLIKGKRGAARLRHMTRNMPRRKEELLDGGSIYWVIRGLIRVRQRVISLDRLAEEDARPRCAIGLDTALVRVDPRSRGPFQGWRYLEVTDAPSDLLGRDDDEAEMPDEMAAALRNLGLI
jgi:hypothetical protein